MLQSLATVSGGYKAVYLLKYIYGNTHTHTAAEKSCSQHIYHHFPFGNCRQPLIQLFFFLNHDHLFDNFLFTLPFTFKTVLDHINMFVSKK